MQCHRRGQAALLVRTRPVHDMQINDLVIYIVQGSIRCLLIKAIPPSAAAAPICFPFFLAEPHIKPPSHTMELSTFTTAEPSLYTTVTIKLSYNALLAHAIKFPSSVKMTMNLPLPPSREFGASS